MTEVLHLEAPRNEIEAAGAGAFELRRKGAEDGDFRFHPVEGQLVIDFIPTANTCSGDIIIGEGKGAAQFETFFGDGAGSIFIFLRSVGAGWWRWKEERSLPRGHRAELVLEQVGS